MNENTSIQMSRDGKEELVYFINHYFSTPKNTSYEDVILALLDIYEDYLERSSKYQNILKKEKTDNG